MKRNGFLYAQLWLLSVFILFCLNTNAQDRHLDSLYLYQPAFTSSSDVLSITGEGGFIKDNNKTGIIDDIMLYPDWHHGFVNFKNGEQLRDVALKFNLLKTRCPSLNLFENSWQASSVSRFDPPKSDGQRSTYCLI